MSFKTTVFAAVAAAALAMPAFAEGIMVQDPYARASSMMSNSGAAFMMIMNHTGQDDHLVSASSDVAERVELHTHKEDENGVMRMIHVEEGFDLPKDGMIAMERGGKHVMFLGLNHALEQGEVVELTLTFEKAGDVTVEVPVDLDRKPMHGNMQMNHGNMKMGQPSN